MAKAPIARLMRITWDTVGAIVERVIAERPDPRRLDGLRLVGVDEVAYRRRHRHLTAASCRSKGPQQRHLPGLLRRARRAAGDDPRSLDRHERRQSARHPRRGPARRERLHQPRLLYALEDPAPAPARLAAWLRWATRSRPPPVVKAARTPRRHRDGMLAAISRGPSNGRLEPIVPVAAREFIAFWMVGDRVLAGMNRNVWDVTDDIQRRIRERVAVDDRRLADPQVPLGELLPVSRS